MPGTKKYNFGVSLSEPTHAKVLEISKRFHISHSQAISFAVELATPRLLKLSEQLIPEQLEEKEVSRSTKDEH
jgi:hypothetical protein